MFDWIKPQRPALTPEAVRAADALVQAEGLKLPLRAQDEAQSAETKVAQGASHGWLKLGSLGAVSLGLEMLDAATQASKEYEEQQPKVWERPPLSHETWHPSWDEYFGP